MTRIRWAELSPHVVEQMVAVLLSQLHAGEAERIDGLGGDGGRDVQLPTADGVRLFEIKSFTGRVGPSQRRQITASLERAAGLQPLDWTLIVPIDHNPAELAWFERLQGTVNFPISWRGLTWLDGEFSTHPAIARYYVDGVAEELADLARLFSQERASLAGGVRDVIDRVSALSRRADEIDPHYRVKITAEDGNVGIEIVPRYPGAERDRPITGSFRLAFPNTDEGRAAEAEFRRAVEYGTPVTVPSSYTEHVSLDAPAGLGGQFEGVTIQLLPSDIGNVEGAAIVEIVGPSGRVLAGVPLTLTLRSRGEIGAIFEGSDRTGWLQSTWELNSAAQTGHFEFRVRSQDYFPGDLLPVVRLLESAVHPNSLRLVTETGAPLASAQIPEGVNLANPGFTSLVEDLAQIQWASRTTRRVSLQLANEDLREVAAAAALLRGETVTGSWNAVTIKLSPETSEDARRDLATQRLFMDLGGDGPYVAQISGSDYGIGAGVRTHLESAELAPEHADMREAGIVQAGAQIRMVPGSSRACTTTLVNDRDDGTEATAEVLSAHLDSAGQDAGAS